MQSEETIANNAAVRLFVAIFVAIVIFLLFGYYSWWAPRQTEVIVSPQAQGKTVVVPSGSSQTVIVESPK